MKKYKAKVWKKKIKKYWSMLDKIEDEYNRKIYRLEKLMEKETGIEGIEFFRSPDDGSMCGVGNVDRTMELIHRWI